MPTRKADGADIKRWDEVRWRIFCEFRRGIRRQCLYYAGLRTALKSYAGGEGAGLLIWISLMEVIRFP